MHTLLSLVVVGISIQGLGTGNWTPRRRRRSCWTRPGALGKAASCSRDHVSKLDICVASKYNRCECKYTYTIIPMWDYVLLHCIMFSYSIVWKSTIDLFLDMVMISMGNGICHVCAPAIIPWARKIIEQSATSLQYSSQKSMTIIFVDRINVMNIS